MNIFDAHISGGLSVSASAEISNNLLVSGNLTVLGWISGSVSGNITNADSASFAPKYTLTSSFNTFTSSHTTGSFTGSFKGDGSGLYNIPASGITNLNLAQIKDGTARAFISETNGLNVNTDLKISGSILPSVRVGDNVSEYNLGSSTNAWRHLYISTGSIKFVNDLGLEQGRITINPNSGQFNILNTSGLTQNEINQIELGNVPSASLSDINIKSLNIYDSISAGGSMTASVFTGSFKGDGSGLYNIPASGVTGLNLTQIADGSATASISSTDGLRINTKSEISGSLKLVDQSSHLNIVGNSFGETYIQSVNNNLVLHPLFGDVLVKGTNLNTDGYISSSTNFRGDGSGLYNIPASGVTGLNLTQIADGSTTASISNTNGLRVNSNTEITGALNLNKMTLGVDNIITSTITDYDGKYYINGIKNPVLTLIKGFTYRFYYDNDNTHPWEFSLTNDGTHNGGVAYTQGVTTNAVPFYIEIKIDNNTPNTLYYFCDHHIGMGNSISIVNDVLNSVANNNIVFINPSRVATTGSNSFTGSQNISGSINLTGSLNITGSISLNGVPVGTGKLDETTFNSYTSSNDLTNTTQSLRLTSIETTTSSLNTFSSSIDTTIKNKLNTESVISGSIQVNITGTTGYSTFSSSINSLSSSIATTTNDLSSNISSSVGSLSSSVATTTLNLKNRVDSIETSTSSLNSFTSSINTTIKDKMNADGVLSGSITFDISVIPGFSGLTNTVSSSISSSVSELSGSLTVTVTNLSSSLTNTDENQNNRITHLETASGSLNSFTSSINTTIKSKLNTEGVISGSLQVNLTGTTGYNTFSSSIATTTSDLSSNISSSVGSLSSSVATTTSNLSSSVGSLSSSVAITTNGISTTVSNLSSSVATTTSNLSSSIGSLSSSVATTTNDVSTTVSNLSSSVATTTSGISTTVSNLSSSVATTTSNLSSSIGSLSSSVATTTSGISTIVTNLSSSVAITTSGITTNLTNLSSSVVSLSSSIATTTSNLSSSIGSLSSSVATTDLNQNNRLGSIENKSGSYATTGSNIFQGNQTITGSLYISQDLIVAGSSSIQHISSSIVNIEDNIITVNAQNPSIRFGGLAVIDSGSSPQVSGSILFDSVENQWIFVHQNQSSITSSMLIMGPETYNNLGNETHLTNNKIVKSVNDEHIGDSNITDTGTIVSINSNTEVTGTLKVTGNITSPNITSIETSTGSLNTFTSSVLAAVELTGSNLTVKGNLLVKGTTTNVNTTTLDVDNNLINLNGTGATSAGLRVKDTTGPNQVSGSLLWDATNDYWIAGQLGSEQRLVRETEFNNAVTRIGNVETSTGSLNSFTSSINTTIKSKLNSDGVISGSIQVNHNATTNYDANQHVDHTTVSISAGNGLSGGGTIAATRTLTLDTGSTHFTSGVKSKLNTDVVMSGSYLGTATTANLTENASYLYYTDARVKTKLNTDNVMSGSYLGTATTANLTENASYLYYTDTRVKTKLNTDNVMSGSYLGTATTANLTENASYLYYTDARVKTKLSAEGVISGSAQVTGLSNSQLTNSSITIGSTAISLGATGTTIAGLTSLSSTAFTGSLQGNATNITATSNTTLTSLSNLNTVGTITGGTWNGTAIANSYLANSSFYIGTTSISLGRASSAQALTGINSIDGTSSGINSSAPTLAVASESNSIYVTAPSYTTGQITKPMIFDWYGNYWAIGNIRSSGVGTNGFGIAFSGITPSIIFTTTSISINGNTAIHAGNYTSYTVPTYGATSINTLGTITGGTWNGAVVGSSYGGAGTVSGIMKANGSGTVSAATAGTDYVAPSGTFYIGTTSVAHNRASATLALTGVSIDGNAGTATTLATARNIQGVSFNGSADITVVTAGTGVSVSGTAVSIGQSVATTATPTFGNMTINGNLVVTGVTYSAAGATIQGAGAYDWFYVGRGSSASALWIKDITGAGWALMGGSYSLAFKKDVSGTSWATALSLTATSSGDTSPNVSITNNLSIGGTVTSGTWNGSSIATTYTAAKVTAVNAGTGVSVDTTTGSVTVSIGQAVATTSNVTFARVTTPKIAIERNANVANGISWYNISTYTSWCDYMSAGGTTSTGPSGNITASTGTYVTSWARRFFVEDASTYGWIFEKGAVAGQPSVVAELRSSDGLFSTAGAIYSAGSLVKTSANSSYSTTFSSVTSVTVTHNLGTKDVAVFVYDSSDNMFWPSSIVTTSTSVVTVTFASSRSGRVVVIR